MTPRLLSLERVAQAYRELIGESWRAGVFFVSDRQPYNSDLSDERWALIEPVIASWKARHPSVSGHQGAYEMREIVNALLYQSRTGCQWDYLPHDLLRWQARESRGRKADPSLVVLDTQSLHAAVGVPAGTTGRNAAKNSPGPQARPGS
ncbi:hypothetical protein SGRIM119S_07266 [Streptomyces griseorubiginosus]